MVRAPITAKWVRQAAQNMLCCVLIRGGGGDRLKWRRLKGTKVTMLPFLSRAIIGENSLRVTHTFLYIRIGYAATD